VSEAHGSTSRPGLVATIREDYRARGGGALSPGFHAVAVYRFGRWARSAPQPGRTLWSLIHSLLYVVVRNLYGIELPVRADVGRRLSIAHAGGIVLNPHTVIGDDCLLRHNITIGVGVVGGSAPTIGSRVEIGAGAVLVGDITVGDDARIGPNAVVMSDVPAGGSAFATPARVMKQTSSPATSNGTASRASEHGRGQGSTT
jgi:serine O-acetyltransferase